MQSCIARKVYHDYMASSVSGQDEPSRTIGYPSGEDRAILTARDYPLFSREIFPRKTNNKYFIDQGFSVKTVGYWPHSFLRVYGPRPRLSP